MNYEEAFEVADLAVFAKIKRHLTDVQVVVLRGSWQEQTYEEIAEASCYSPKFLKQDVGPKLWKLLSEALGEPVSKTNFQAALERRWRSHILHMLQMGRARSPSHKI